MPLADRFRRHADSLERSQRSPLYVTLMRHAANDIELGGQVAELFDGVDTPPGSLPALRLLAALHHLVLSGQAPTLALFFPSAGGTRPPDDVWPFALDAMREHADWIRDRLALTVQTNEPGRSAVLYAALLWLGASRGLPVRLLEIGASAGLNLLPDRYAYVSGGQTFGDPESPLRFHEPWTQPPPGIDPAVQPHIAHREGCDPAPLDARKPEDRVTVLSYIWPDELERFERTRIALELAAKDPPRVVAARAEDWLPDALARRSDAQLTVVWQSVVRQYVDSASWPAIERAVRNAPGQPVWLRMEPRGEHVAGFQLTTGDEEVLAQCGDHGPPVSWRL